MMATSRLHVTFRVEAVESTKQGHAFTLHTRDGSRGGVRVCGVRACVTINVSLGKILGVAITASAFSFMMLKPYWILRAQAHGTHEAAAHEPPHVAASQR